MKALALSFAIAFSASTALADVFGSRASFLLMESEGMSLSYLSTNVDDQWRLNMENALLANGDTHIYVYSHNEGDDVGDVSPQPNWESRLNRLNNRGLKPVFWLMADDSPTLAAKPLSYHKAHNAEIVRRFDDKVDHYVVCLECDEYWSAAQVQSLVADLKQRTDKPVAVHLTPSFKPEYFKNADIVFVQTGFNLNEAQFRAKVQEALDLGKPVVVAEYSLDSSSATARHYGDIACSMGAIGTGNGRSVEACGQKPPEKEKWYDEYQDEMIVAGVAMASIFAVTYFDLPFHMSATEETFEVGVSKRMGSHLFGVTYSENRSIAAYSFEF
jgi:hypothetical protein